MTHLPGYYRSKYKKRWVAFGLMFALVLVIVEFDIREIRPFLPKKTRWFGEKIIKGRIVIEFDFFF